MKNNPFQKGTLAYLFYKIDKFLTNSKSSMVKNIKDIFNIFSFILLPLEIIFILVKLVVVILWSITIGLIITSIIS